MTGDATATVNWSLINCDTRGYQLNNPCLSGCVPSVNLRSFPDYVNQACVSDITAGVHETFPG